MKKMLSFMLAAVLILSALTIVPGAKEDYTSIFKKDSVIDISIEMETDDLEDMRNYPRNEEYHAADITVDGVKTENAGIRTKGNMTLNSVASSDSERYSYRIKFDKYVKGNTLLGLDELCLNSGYSDPSYMREYLHYETLRELGMNVPETVFCRVYINGEYAGLYLAVEGLDDTFLENNFGEDYKDGNFYKMDEGATLEYKENEDYSYADLKSGADKDLTEFKAFVKKLNAVENGEKGDIESFLNVDSALKYIASNTVLCNYDSYNGNMHHNYYLYEDKNGVFTVVPWDFNMSFGGFNGSNSEVGIDMPYISGSLETLPLMGKLLSVPEYKEKYYGYVKQIMSILENFETRVSEVKKVIAPYVKADTAAFYTYDEFDKATSKQTETENKPTESAEGDNAAQSSADATAAQSDTEVNSKNKNNVATGGKNGGRGKGFGGESSSIINCVSDRLENLKAQFDGTADKTTTASRGGFDDKRGGGRGGDFAPPQSNGENEKQPPEMPNGGGRGGDFAPPQSNGENGEQPPEMPNGGDRRGGGFGGGVGGQNGNSTSGSQAIRVHVNGHIVKFDTDPYTKNDTTLVGFRTILEALGMKVDWDEESQTVTAVKDDTTVKMTVGSNIAYVNGERVELAAAPEIASDTTMVPIRFIAEGLGMKVEWEESSRLITITSKK